MSRMLARFSRRKVLDVQSLGSSKLDRCLSTFDLIALGVGSTLGVGIYVLAGTIAKDVAGPSVILSFLIAGVASALSGICYAELGARVPKAGSAYVYSYVTVGELMAFVIGWNLLLEYAIGAASVSRAYSGYLDTLINKTMQKTFRYYMPMNVPHLSPYPDLCSLLLALVLTCILSFGVKESTRFNNVFTCLNLAVVGLVTVAGLLKSDLNNWNLPESSLPDDVEGGHGGFFPFGISGTLAGGASAFYGYVGFDSIATSAEEAKNPSRSIPIAICVSLGCVFLGYFGVSSALTLMVPYYLQDPDAPLPAAFRLVGWTGVGNVVTVGALFGLSTSLLGCMFPLPRVIYAMAEDGLIFRGLAKVSPTFATPLRATILAGTFVGVTSAIFDLKSLVDMMSIGTLLAYTLVSTSVILLRYQDIPGLASNGDYIPLGSLSDQTAVLQHEDDDSDSEDEEIVYCRNTDLSQLKLEAPSASFGLSLGDFCRGLVNMEKSRVPTASSVKVASSLTVTYVLLAALLALTLNYADFEQSDSVVTVLAEIFLGILVFSMTLCLVFLSLQPKTTQLFSFKVPFVPVIPGLSIFVNMYLMLKLGGPTWIRFAVWMAVGFIIYGCYGCKQSSEEFRMNGRCPPDPNRK